MSNNTYGYCRVSTKDQHEDRQRIALINFGVPTKNIVVDKVSGKNFNRPAYQKLIKKLKPNDLLVIKSIDRLGRNYTDIIEQWRIITNEKKADIVVLDMPLLDTRNKKDLIGTLLTDVVLPLLSYFAQNELDSIRQRQAEGIAAAKARGVKFGRKTIQRPYNFDVIFKQWKAGDISARKAAKLLGVSHFTFLKWTKN